MNYLAQKLTRLGLSTLESQVYLGLLERQLTTAGALAKHLGHKRSTVYTILDSLIEKGLASQTQVEHVKHFQAESPSRIADFLDKQREQLEAKEDIYKSIEEDLNKLTERQIQPPKVSIYEGKKGVDTLLMKNLDDEPTQVYVFGEYFQDQDHIEDYTQRRIKMGIPTEVIVPKSKYALECVKIDPQSNRKTRIIPKKYRFPASVHVYDRSVSIFTYTGEDPVGVHIENEDISTTMKMLFELLSASLEDPKG